MGIQASYYFREKKTRERECLGMLGVNGAKGVRCMGRKFAAVEKKKVLPRWHLEATLELVDNLR